MSSEQKPLEILEQYWGFGKFRPLQEEIINSTLKGKDTLALLPTGGGKSICFQVPAMIMQGLCLVISPLIALMKDQVENLEKKGIKAEALFSGKSKKEQSFILERAVSDEIKFLYVSPERLASEDFRGWLRNMNLSLIAVDEAHCISQWGYDFRPEYLRIAEIRDIFPSIPVLALTASATPPVVKDIIKQLKFKNPDNIFSKSFIRENLTYLVRKVENKSLKIIEASKKIKGSGIVYTRNRKGTEELAKLLKNNGESADFYHAGLELDQRNKKQKDWIDNKTRIMICTNAFGMGIDKPDVRFVFHLEPPDCIESYYQEAGRAGRDGKPSFCVLYYFENDLTKELDKIEERYPDNKILNTTYQTLCNYLGVMVDSGQGINHDFDLTDFCKTYNLPVLSTYHAIDILHKQGFLNLSESGIFSSSLKILLSSQELYKLQVKNEDYNLLFLAILRTRGGYFDFYTPIDELKIALLLNIQVQKVKEMLTKLHKDEYVDYQPKTSTPQLTLLESRYQKINPDRTLIEFLKKRAIERFLGIKQYIDNETICRNRLISKYFGESTKTDCGICDVCRAKNEKPLSAEKFKLYESAIQNELKHNKLHLETLKIKIEPKKVTEFIQALEWMIENAWIVKDRNGMLEWKRKK